MEAWQARQRPIGNTKDQLEQQSRELKVSAFKLILKQGAYAKFVPKIF